MESGGTRGVIDGNGIEFSVWSWREVVNAKSHRKNFIVVEELRRQRGVGITRDEDEGGEFDGNIFKGFE